MADATLAQLGKHQIGSLVATVVDFGSMVAWVQLVHVSPVGATALGATAGGVTNFLLGRSWIFRAAAVAALPQALRYAVVSAASAGWNSAGEWLVHDRLGVQYLLARAIVAVVVSLAWNYPMQRHFVFRT